VAPRAVSLNRGQLVPLERTGAVRADLFAGPVSEGTLAQAVAAGHEPPATAAAASTRGGEPAGGAHCAETGLHIAGHTSGRHVASTARLPCDATHRQRGWEALDAIGILPP
jgi:hypothetical protein